MLAGHWQLRRISWQVIDHCDGQIGQVDAQFLRLNGGGGVAVKKYSADKRDHALRIFIESRGNESLSSIARKLGVHRKTVAKWKEKDGWDAKLSETCQMTAKKTAEKISEALSEQMANHFRVDSEHLDILDKILFLQLIERDENGQPVRGIEQ